MDKFAAMRTFVKIAEAGSLSAAGRQLGLSLTSVSRRLIALEEMLGTTLVERTTRHLSLTEAGRLYHERAKEILEEVAEAECSLAAQTGVASGRLYVSSPSLLGRMRLSPMLPTFLAEQTQVSIDLMLVDRPVRLAEERIDVALRVGPLEDSGLVARKLDDVQLVVCAAPDYLRRRGEPATPDDLIEQDCLGFSDVPGVAEWSFQAAQHEKRRTFRRGFAPMTSMRWFVPLWQGPGSSECHPGRLPIFLTPDGCGLCLGPISDRPRR
jgi:DNA-binding transcriptional LysR family regulator